MRWKVLREKLDPQKPNIIGKSLHKVGWYHGEL